MNATEALEYLITNARHNYPTFCGFSVVDVETSYDIDFSEMLRCSSTCNYITHRVRLRIKAKDCTGEIYLDQADDFFKHMKDYEFEIARVQRMKDEDDLAGIKGGIRLAVKDLEDIRAKERELADERLETMRRLDRLFDQKNDLRKKLKGNYCG